MCLISPDTYTKIYTKVCSLSLHYWTRCKKHDEQIATNLLINLRAISNQCSFRFTKRISLWASWIWLAQNVYTRLLAKLFFGVLFNKMMKERLMDPDGPWWPDADKWDVKIIDKSPERYETRSIKCMITWGVTQDIQLSLLYTQLPL